MNQVALVTGASRGIGFAIAERLLSAGMAVCITARKPSGLGDAAARLRSPDRLLAIEGHSDDPDHRRAATDAVVSRFGRLDVLVNNAGINPAFGDLLDGDEVAYRKILEVNLLAAVGWARELKRVTAGHAASIVNISSFVTLRPSRGLGMYGASKAALGHLTRQLALELAPSIRVNAVAPALIATEFAGRLFDGRREAVEATYPLGRLGNPADVAAAVAFLVSEGASWITGECLLIDGGLSLTGGVE